MPEIGLDTVLGNTASQSEICGPDVNDPNEDLLKVRMTLITHLSLLRKKFSRNRPQDDDKDYDHDHVEEAVSSFLPPS